MIRDNETESMTAGDCGEPSYTTLRWLSHLFRVRQIHAKPELTCLRPVPEGHTVAPHARGSALASTTRNPTLIRRLRELWQSS